MGWLHIAADTPAVALHSTNEGLIKASWCKDFPRVAQMFFRVLLVVDIVQEPYQPPVFLVFAIAMRKMPHD